MAMVFVKVKSWYGRVSDFITVHQKKIKYFTVFLSGLFLLMQFAVLSSLNFSASASRAIIGTVNNDTGIGIQNALDTLLINDNHTRTYGPVYYRLSVFMRYLGSFNYGESNGGASISSQENLERTVFFHLQMINLISVFAAGFLFSWFFLKRLEDQLLATLLFSSLVLQNMQRSSLIFVAKPDSLFAFLVLAASILALFYFFAPNETEIKKRWLKYAGLLWGVVLSTKLTGVFFLPAGLILLPMDSLSSFKRDFLQFAKFILIGFFVVGFPQNFSLWPQIEYLHFMSQLSSKITWDFFLHWMDLFWLDLKPQIFWVLLAFLFFSKKESDLQKFGFKTSLKLLIFALFPTVLLVSKKLDNPHDWYTFPFTFLLILIFAMFLWRALIWFESRFFVNSLRQKPLWYFVVLIFVPYLVSIYPSTYEKAYAETQVCRKEAVAMKNQLDQLAAAGQKILADPYVPYNLQAYHDKQILMSWDITQALVQKVKPDYIAWSWGQMKHLYLDPEREKQKWNREIPLKDFKEFLAPFVGQSATKDSTGQVWNRIYGDACQFEIWQRGE